MTPGRLRTVRVALGLGAAELAQRLHDATGEDVLRVEERDLTGRRDRWTERVHHDLEDELERELRARYPTWQDAAFHAGIPAPVAAEAFGVVPLRWPASTATAVTPSNPNPEPARAASTDFGASADW